MKNTDKNLLESLIEKYGVAGVEAAINKLNEEFDNDADREFEERTLIYREIYDALANACFRLERQGVKITQDVIEIGVEWFDMHNEFYDAE